MPRRVGSPSSIFLFNATLPPHRPTNMPRGLLFPEISSKPCWYVLFGIPACYDFHVLNGRVFNPSVILRINT